MMLREINDRDQSSGRPVWVSHQPMLRFTRQVGRNIALIPLDFFLGFIKTRKIHKNTVTIITTSEKLNFELFVGHSLSKLRRNG